MPQLRKVSSLPKLLIELRTEDLKSLTSIRTHVNTRRNSPDRSLSVSSHGSTLEEEEEVEKCTKSCCKKSVNGKSKKVRFAHPTVTALIEPEPVSSDTSLLSNEGHLDPFNFKFTGVVYSDEQVSRNQLPFYRQRRSKASRVLGLQNVQDEAEWEDTLSRIGKQ